ncbi:MAG: glycosyltransferase family 2 protein [Magnetococcales bacterium]|nr:glycosyltransferase family 2 protein [Magnetococcales bacterium]NGZ06248.1 glycosyltransferase family 2 protein [Magnetococcales bacterium]
MDLSIIIPVYQSEPCLTILVERIHQALQPEMISFEIILVNDGSSDGSWNIISQLCALHPDVVGINHRRNFGQDNAIMSGLRLARGTLIVTMDDDLQHDPNDLPRLLAAIRTSDADVIFGASPFDHDPLWKRLGRQLHSRTLEWLLNKPRHLQFTSYRIMRAPVAKDIIFYEGAFPFIDALLVQVTTRFEQIPVNMHARLHGRSNYTLFKSLQLWMKLLVSFSIRPLRIVTFTGILAFVVGMIAASIVIVQKLFWPETFAPFEAGWASLIVVMLIMNGMQMCFIGILGEYVGRTYVLVSQRPQAVIAKILNRPMPPQ